VHPHERFSCASLCVQGIVELVHAVLWHVQLRAHSRLMRPPTPECREWFAGISGTDSYIANLKRKVRLAVPVSLPMTLCSGERGPRTTSRNVTGRVPIHKWWEGRTLFDSCLPACPPARLPACLPACPPACLPACLPVCLQRIGRWNGNLIIDACQCLPMPSHIHPQIDRVRCASMFAQASCYQQTWAAAHTHYLHGWASAPWTRASCRCACTLAMTGCAAPSMGVLRG